MPSEESALNHEDFPLSSKYDPQWVLENEMGPNALWLTESLCNCMELRPGMRVLDLGCGKAMTSIFLAKEYGVQVWATDLWIQATDNWKRIREAGVGDRVFPIHAEARSLPFAEEFFGAIVCVDTYFYYGTDDFYLGYFAKFVRRGGQIGVIHPGLTRDLNGTVPQHLQSWPFDGYHTALWWRRHWERTGLVDVELAHALPNGWGLWLRWEEARDAAGATKRGSDADVIRADSGRYLGFVRMVARRRLE